MNVIFYERLFLLNRYFEQVAEILEQFKQDEVIHPVFASDRQRTIEELRADLSHVLTGMLHQRELESCVGLTRKRIESESKNGQPNEERSRGENELYIELFHGRKDKEQDMDDWGSTGPVFGPLCYAHTTYGNEIKLGKDGDEYGVLRVNDGMVYYNGIWYGDWSVFHASTFAESTDLQTRLQQFEEERAEFGFIVKTFSGGEEWKSTSRFDNEDDALEHATIEHLRLQHARQYGYTVILYEYGANVQGNCAEITRLEVE